MARVDVVMPKMGESVMEGTVLEWKKAVGDAVEPDETLLEISTDKVDSEVPSPEGGVLVEIKVEEGDTVDVGVAIAVIETDVNAAGDAAPAETPPAAEPEAAAPAAAPEPAAPEPAAPAVEMAPEVTAQATADGASVGGGRVEVVMPKMGESVMEGTVLTWSKAVGDTVEQDETLLEISTDKVDSEVPSPEAGTLVEILVEEGDTVDVGVAIAVIATGDAAAGGASPAPQAPEPAQAVTDVPAPAEKSYSAGEAPGPVAQAASGDGAAMPEPSSAAPSGAAPSEPAGPIPRRDDAGNFYSPLVRSIAETEGVSLAELQGIQGTGADGRVSKTDLMGYLDARGAQPTPAQPATSVGAPGETEPEAKPAAPVVRPVGTPAPATNPVTPAATPQPAAPKPAAPQPAAPQPAAPKPAPAAPQTQPSDRVEIIEMDRMRQLIAEHMRRSKDTSAHVTSFAEVDMTGVVRHREAHKADFQAREGVKLTFTPYFLQAAIEPLQQHPLMNSSVEGSRVVVKKDFHIGIAVAIGTKGLLVPIVRDAGQQNLSGLTHTIADLAQRARNKKLQPDELQGGTFTITNVGSLGSLMGTPIINQPQVAILSPGAIVKRPVVVTGPDGEDVIAIRHMMYVSLSYDHRIIDGSMAASFLAAYRASLEAVGPDSALL